VENPRQRKQQRVFALSELLRLGKIRVRQSDNFVSNETLAIRAGQVRTMEGEHSDPIFATSSYIFENAAQAAARFSGTESGNVYSRFTNPTVRAFEQRLAALEGGLYAVATASGMSAITLLLLSLVKEGDHVVCSNEVFGSTISVFAKVLPRFGIEVEFAPVSDVRAWQSVVRANTRLLFIETPTNPLCNISDIKALSEIAHDIGGLLVVDNAFCTPALQKPLALGADIIVHSATKYLDGQGRCVGGAVVTSNEEIYQKIFKMLRITGPAMSPFNAWVFHKGLETLPIRMQLHSDNAEKLAKWLLTQPDVDRVYYPGLTDHPGHVLAKTQQEGFGGILSFEVKGGRTEAWQVIDRTSLISITANLGDVKTTITHPASTTHAHITTEQRAAAGIKENLIRIAAGLEAVADIIDDLSRAFLRPEQ
tara:strand:+ start:2391 stop:3659 length:1269 start_codon:yes stop_codon:yes gene_type:complete